MVAYGDMTSARLFSICAIIIILILGLGFFALPSQFLNVYLSPDETANATIAQAFSETGKFSLARNPDFAWVHPRSFVSTPENIVPVAFLGMPAILAVIYRMLGYIGMSLFTPLLAISSVIPLWSFTRKLGRTGQIATTVSWMVFPSVLLYANRGLFPNLPVLCLAIWSSWLIWRYRNVSALLVSGALSGLALIIRPVEAVWILPWILTAWQYGEKKQIRDNLRAGLIFLAPFVFILFAGAWLGRQTYGSWFTIGYRLRDIEAPSIPGPKADSNQTAWLNSWPFGFHPLNVWFNAKAYLAIFLWPWFLVSLMAVFIAWKKNKSRLLIYLAVWTVLALSLIYGQSLYQDHVKQNQVSLANSFLRYLLPVAVIGAVSVGVCVSELVSYRRRLGIAVSIVFVFVLAGFSYWTAFSRDDEGLWQNRIELTKYAEVNLKTRALFEANGGAVILSERSDKIFFPSLMAVSPLPARDRIRRLMEIKPVALYLRTQTPEQIESWSKDGIYLELLFTAGNESLYLAKNL